MISRWRTRGTIAAVVGDGCCRLGGAPGGVHLERPEHRTNEPLSRSFVVCRLISSYRPRSHGRESSQRGAPDDTGPFFQEAGIVMGMDVVALGLTLGFFALSVGLIALCERL